jgi:hypothetical protein
MILYLLLGVPAAVLPVLMVLARIEPPPADPSPLDES